MLGRVARGKALKDPLARPFIRLHKACGEIDFLAFPVYQRGSVITFACVM